MKNLNSLLPDFPQTGDVWEDLKRETRPIVVYGMGNGADKLLSRFRARGIEVADFFASDGFVRGHSFHGKTVLSFSDIREKYDDFRIVLSFASNRPEVLSMLYGIDAQYGITMPDLPVAGDGDFDKDFYNAHEDEICAAYGLLADEHSRALYSAVLHYKLTGNISYLRNFNSSVEACYGLFDFESVRTAVDAGAYNGDTASEMLRINPKISHIVAIEPDLRNYKKLCRFAENEKAVAPIRAAVSDMDGVASFSASGNRNSTLLCGSYEQRSESVPLITIDSLSLSPDYIKYDVEGAERDALLGSADTILRARPYLTVSAYHRNEDIFALPLLCAHLAKDYDFYYRRIECLPAWELRLVGVPKEKSVLKNAKGI